MLFVTIIQIYLSHRQSANHVKYLSVTFEIKSDVSSIVILIAIELEVDEKCALRFFHVAVIFGRGIRTSQPFELQQDNTNKSVASTTWYPATVFIFVAAQVLA